MADKESENRMEKKNEGTNKKEKTKKLWTGLLVAGLLSFMLFCFGPMEMRENDRRFFGDGSLSELKKQINELSVFFKREKNTCFLC